MSNLYKISSSKRNTGSINDYTIQFSSPLPEGLYKLKQAVIPNSIFVVNNTNNKIYFEENGGSILTATLTTGDYTPSTLITQISNSMTAISASSGLARTYTATFSSVTNLFTITVSSSSFKMLMATYTTNSASIITGFNVDDTSFASSQVSDSVVNFTNNIYSFNLNIQSQSVINYLVDNSGVSYSFSVPVTTSYGNICVYEPTVNYYIKLDSPTRVLKVQVRDDSNVLVPLNSDYYFILELYN
jgi:hypothetical protein